MNYQNQKNKMEQPKDKSTKAYKDWEDLNNEDYELI